MKIKIDELEKAIGLLLSRFKSTLGNEVELNSDYYWNIVESDIYNPYKEPTDLTLGQLSDDWVEIIRQMENNNLMPYETCRLANILRALAIENPIAF